MKSLYLRIWLTVVAALALFALVSGWMWQRHVEQERERVEAVATERLAAWAELVQRSLPGADAPIAEQAEALREWSGRLRVPLALDDRRGVRIAASESFANREANSNRRAAAVRLDDGRTLWLARRSWRRGAGDGPHNDDLAGWRGIANGTGSPGNDPGMGPGSGPGMMHPPRGPMLGEHLPGPALGGRNLDVGGLPPDADSYLGLTGLAGLSLGLPKALGPLILVAMLFVAVAAGAFPVVRRLTRRLEALKQGVQAFGAGDLSQRVDASGRDEVAAVAETFNHAAARIETLVKSHQNLLANASHELRSPLARLKMAVAMYTDMPEAQRAGLRREIDANVAELDALVEEVLLASRLDAGPGGEQLGPVDLLALAAEEAARVGAEVEALAGVGGRAELPGTPGASMPAQPLVNGNERLLRRALRNLLENANRYGGGEISTQVSVSATGRAQIRVSDRGPGVPAALRERIFEPFFRLPGHAEREGGVGLGLSLVRQIAQRHGGSVHCEARAGGGSSFVINLPGEPASVSAGSTLRS